MENRAEGIGMSSLILMENAGRGLAEVVLGQIGSNRERIALFAGTGNNAGDGFVCARHLANSGISVEIFVVGSEERFTPQAKVNFNVLRKMQISIQMFNHTSFNLEKCLERYRFILDALLGIGIRGEVREPIKTVIRLLNKCPVPKIAVDIPSGLDADTGEIKGICLRAHQTVTFLCPKRGFYLKDGPAYTGKIIEKDIGIGRQFLS